MANVRLKNVTKKFGDIVAVNNLNLDIADQEFLVLVGPSGCGKSTALRMVAGLETPTEGEIYIGKRLVNNLLPKHRDIAMVFQSYALYPHLTVAQNLAFPLMARKVPKNEMVEKAKETAKLLGIGDLLNRKPKELSGGQRQRVALGRSLIREPKVWLMDEPLSNLDAKLRVRMRAELKQLQKELKITTIYVTHDQVEAMTMGDRIAILRDGLLQQLGDPTEVFNKPINEFVAGFIGSPPMNFNETTIIERNGKIALDLSDFELPLPQHIGDMIRDRVGSTVTMGIRPSAIYDRTLHKEATLENIFKAHAYVVEPMGDQIHVHFRIGSATFVAVFPPESKVTMGEDIDVFFDVNRVYIFDKKTTKTIV
ncbi:MAG: ABC transporter ATP-binding protein [Candidatus Heimdallarchaeota archaeon]